MPNFKGDVPVLARGSQGPLQGELHSAEYFHGRDGLADISARHPEISVQEGWQSPLLRLTDQSAVDLSLDLIRDNPYRSVTYIALGPLTNLSHMMRKDAALIRDRIGRIIAMGGALETAGNVTAVAECEFLLVSVAVGFDVTCLSSQLLCRPVRCARITTSPRPISRSAFKSFRVAAARYHRETCACLPGLQESCRSSIRKHNIAVAAR